MYKRKKIILLIIIVIGAMMWDCSEYCMIGYLVSDQGGIYIPVMPILKSKYLYDCILFSTIQMDSKMHGIIIKNERDAGLKIYK